MKKFIPFFILAALVMAGCKSNVQEPAATDTAANAATVEEDIINTSVNLNDKSIDTLANFKGGDGEVYMKMSMLNNHNKVMLCTLPAGSSVGYHAHETDMEVIYVLQGTATILLNDVEQEYTTGMVHYCPKGFSHSIHNKTNKDLVIYNVVAAQP